MVGGGGGPSGNFNSIGAAGTAINTVPNRLINSQQGMPLAKFANIQHWQPRIGDFMIWHGWFRRWYGVVSALDQDTLYVIKENLPVLLFTMPVIDYHKSTTKVSITKIVNSMRGEYHILQGDHWYIP